MNGAGRHIITDFATVAIWLHAELWTAQVACTAVKPH